MTHTISPLQQNVYTESHDPILVEDIHESSLSLTVLQRLLDSDPDGIVGVASVYRSDCSISCLAFATITRALVVHFAPPPKTKQQQKNKGKEQSSVYRGRTLLQDLILCDPDVELYGYRIDRIAVALFLDLSLRINAAVDILSINPGLLGRRSLEALMDALGGEILLHRENVKALFAWREGNNPLSSNDVALQAWATCRAATLTHMAPRYATISQIATDIMPDPYLGILAKIARDAEILESKKPTKVFNDVKADFTSSRQKDSIGLVCTRYRTRLMPGKFSDQVVQIETQVGDQRSTITGRAGSVRGRHAHIQIGGAMRPSGKILSVTTIGKENPTPAEAAREDVVRKALQGTINLTEHPFFCSIWMPSSPITWPPPVDGEQTVCNPLIYYPSGTLNASQDITVQKIVSLADEDRVVLIQGPPGTGKTTVIAASVSSIMEYGDDERTIWLIAQSNVAVKNIAEKLDKVAFYDFKLLVSFGFHFDWHEPLYERLEHCFIRSDMLVDHADIKRLLLDTRVILCTLSMLSHHRIGEIIQQVSLHTVIFDEASQIEVGDYLPLLHPFRSSLHKMVFIGDDRQLAPFGQDDVRQLQSVFEFPHLRRKAYFLDTQYRMPVVIGEFISRHVYDRQLKTDHNITTRSACRFLDVKKGQEKRMGNSWVNEGEVAVIIHLARLCFQRGRQYRVITPYDAQRSLIEKQLELAKLPWEDKCFNVDSFQGNEEDHIIVSVVRSDGIGFIKNARRTNVMLTRCKKSMIICTSCRFVSSNKAANTLVGKLAAAMGSEGWLDSRDILNGVLP